MRQKFDLLKQFKLICPVQSLSKKFFALPVGQIISTSPRRLVSQEGRLAIVTKRGAGCGGRGGAATNAQPADGKVVWSWSPDAGIKLAETTSAGDGGKKARSPRRSRRKPLKPLARGMPGETGVTVVTTLVCLFCFCMRGCGRGRRARHSLRPHSFGRKALQNSGAIRAAGLQMRVRNSLFEN